MTPERLRQIEELYHAARERDPDQRADFLAGACKDDEDLRYEVESLLAPVASGSSLLEEPVMRQAAGILISGESCSQHRLAPGLELGPYVIEARLGAGGMGEVYRAKDKRLHRTVAVKVLPSEMAVSPGLRQRLEREAKAISSLNHPHICALYDIGRQEEIDYLVMEFLEGDTLAQRLKRGALPLAKVLEFAIQIAGALAAAHAAGIVHRDLKPGNIMLTKSGAKLLDFGLAKVRAAETGPGAAVDGPAAPITSAGMVVGTLQYMSPEQIQGHEADARSDLFAFGATLYEMLTGQRAFEGMTQLAVASAIQEKDPEPINALQPLTPPALERVVGRCLVKNPQDRWQNTSDLTSELRWIAEAGGTSVTSAGSETAARGRRRELLYGVLAVVFLLAAIISAVSYWRVERASSRAIISEISPLERVRFNLDATPAISPDGRALAFCATDEHGKTMLWVRSLDSLTARALSGTEQAADPFWSPDSRSLGFFADGKLKTIEASGGPAIVVASAGGDGGDGGDGSWNRDGTILLALGAAKGEYTVAAAGGNPVPVFASARPTSEYCAFHRFLPDGKHFLYWCGGGDSASLGTYFASLDGRERRLVIGGTTFAAYASGFLLYVRDGALMAQAFDPDRGQLKKDPPQQVAEGVAESFLNATFDVSENGIVIYAKDNGAHKKRLTWFDRTGKVLGVTGEVGDYYDVRLSPDGRKLAANSGSPNSEIWVDDLARAVHMRLTIDPETDHGVPVWSPDGARIAFSTLRGGKLRGGIYVKSSNGAGGEEVLLSSENSDTMIWPTSWSRDGRLLLYARKVTPHTDIWVLPLAGDRKPRLVVQAQAPAYDGQLSPNGLWLAYTSEESGRKEVYVVPFEAGGALSTGTGLANAGGSGKWQVSFSGGRTPRWRGDGKEIFYLSAVNQMMAAEVEEKGNGIVVPTAQALFKCVPVYSADSSAEYDVSPDGKKFLINTLAGENGPLVLLVNWTANLKKQ